MELRVKRVTPGAIIPTRAHAGDLGYDLYSMGSGTFERGETRLVPTGIAMNLPDGFGAVIKDRSSMAVRGFRVSAGVIDNGYCNEVHVLLTFVGTDPDRVGGGRGYISVGDKIAQLVLVPLYVADVVEVDTIIIPDTRGHGGFGSTGR